MRTTCRCIAQVTETWRGACFGSTGERSHRYALWDRWDERPTLLAIMLNPSTADEHVLDPTLRRVRRYAIEWKHGGFIVANAFALRSTKPAALLADPRSAVGVENDEHLVSLKSIAGRVIVGWGGNLSKPALRFRYAELRDLLGGGDVACWNVGSTGDPGHPLYVSSSAQPAAYYWRPQLPKTDVVKI